ncbi:antibiotic biosynthesis monooxygenase [Amycolatopsis antarctica]|uniref:Antibiotic biosynthesis monooxygenase n=1 Tax=Amycolatopsis antarctica TaxID=1854586 RepID=A0A263CVK1_9PSEU|nr:putative quinol monooxygenase [Amycolatopsis antarctica]OZM70008.1 antibiotic biosynthesis monooxygenase [Amycolatopsis antarctica]
MTDGPLNIVARFQSAPDAQDRLRERLTELIAPTRAERGCLSYRLYVAADDPSALVMVEEWADLESIAAHNESEHLRALSADLPGLVAEPPRITVLQPVQS